MRIVAANRHELWISFGIVILTALFSCIPISYDGALILAGGLSAASLCALNALFDYEEMNVLERVISIFWTPLLFILTTGVVYSLSTIQHFANK